MFIKANKYVVVFLFKTIISHYSSGSSELQWRHRVDLQLSKTADI